MANIEGSFSSMRRYLEKDMLAEALRGRVRYKCPHKGLFEVYMDGKLLKRFCWEAVNSWFIDRGYSVKLRPMDTKDYWKDFWDLMSAFPMEQRGEYTDQEFARALRWYRESDIQASLQSPDPIVKMFALLDRRTGSRSLARLEEEAKTWPDWLKTVYELRLQAAKGGADGDT